MKTNVCKDEEVVVRGRVEDVEQEKYLFRISDPYLTSSFPLPPFSYIPVTGKMLYVFLQWGFRKQIYFLFPHPLHKFFQECTNE